MRNIFKIKGLLFFLIFAFTFTECERVPVTGRRQLDLVPDAQVMALANDQYQQFLNESQVVTGTDQARMVNNVGTNIAQAVERYFQQNNMSDQLEGYNWEFKLVQDPAINAFAMPGGKTVVYTGILPVAQDEVGLAVVMGHEIAHAVAKHGDERMSQQLSTQLGGLALSVALSQKPQQTQNLFMAAYGAGTQVGVLLPYSRLHESEADRLGLLFMAMAGYDPQEAPDFWRRMDAAAQGGKTPELLSTHPSPENRIKNINKYMDEAMQYYKPAVSTNE